MKRFGRAATVGAAIVALLGTASPTRAQTAVVAVAEENFRAAPGGTILAELAQGTRLSLGAADGRWREATLEAWIWGRSVREQQRPDLDLIVNADGENLRDGPGGNRIGRALGATRLERLETRGDWIRVRRTGWIWSASVAAVVADSAGPSAAPDASGDPAPAGARRSTREFATAAAGGIVLHNPSGDTLARLRPGATVEVVARDGGWSRVRIEGWMVGGALADPAAADGTILTQLHLDSLLARPETYRGRLVEWNVQFIALQSAERFRTDFLEGEPFVLARGPDDEPGFVYLAVPEELLERVRRLPPLERIRVLGRIRAGRSSLTGAPVLDLLEIIAR